jgi:hypothetical protein
MENFFPEDWHQESSGCLIFKITKAFSSSFDGAAYFYINFLYTEERSQSRSRSCNRSRKFFKEMRFNISDTFPFESTRSSVKGCMTKAEETLRQF